MTEEIEQRESKGTMLRHCFALERYGSVSFRSLPHSLSLSLSFSLSHSLSRSRSLSLSLSLSLTLPLVHRSVICLLTRARPLYADSRVIVNAHVRSVKLHRHAKRLPDCKGDSVDGSGRSITSKTNLNSRTKQTTAHSIHIPP